VRSLEELRAEHHRLYGEATQYAALRNTAINRSHEIRTAQREIDEMELWLSGRKVAQRARLDSLAKFEAELEGMPRPDWPAIDRVRGQIQEAQASVRSGGDGS